MTTSTSQTPVRFASFELDPRTGELRKKGHLNPAAAAMNRIVSSDFGDPEGLLYLTRHLARVGDTAGALRLLERAAAGGFSATGVCR